MSFLLSTTSDYGQSPGGGLVCHDRDSQNPSQLGSPRFTASVTTHLGSIGDTTGVPTVNRRGPSYAWKGLLQLAFDAGLTQGITALPIVEDGFAVAGMSNPPPRAIPQTMVPTLAGKLHDLHAGGCLRVRQYQDDFADRFAGSQASQRA